VWTAAIDEYARVGPNSSYAPNDVSPWVALDRFIRDMENGLPENDRFSAALSTIRESTRASVAFIYHWEAGRPIEMVGGDRLTPHWCRELTRGLSARYPQGGLWQAGDQGVEWHLPSDPIPHSAVILPLEGASPQWMVAVSVDPELVLDESDLRIVKVIWRLQVGHNRNARVYENLKDTLFGIIRCLSTAIDAKDPYTCGHSERVARIAVRLGDEMGLSRGEISDLYLAGLLHDVGKIGIRDEVLCKPSALTPEERRHINEHPIIGEQIIANVSRLAYLRPAIRGHHERFDGLGYPDALRGEAIPLSARIIAVADSCDAMMSHRRYRPAMLPAHIEKVFREGSGTQWDARVVDCFFKCRHELYPVCQRGLGQSVYMAVERAAGGDSSGRPASEGRGVEVLV
jgi:HD-GYP domain-containing protein (c-di-GMP phosphodiesterase class II)